MGRCQQTGSLVTISCVFKGYGLLAVGVIVGCQSSLISREESDFEPVNPPAWLKNLPDPIVLHEERVAAGNTTPYSVLGETYTVLSDATGYVNAGYASWYGTKFHGRQTANGERYDMYALTAARRRLPAYRSALSLPGRPRRLHRPLALRTRTNQARAERPR